MSRDNVSTPQRGETWYEGETPDTNNLKAVELEGQIKVFEDVNWGSSENVKPWRSGRKVVCRLTRNMSGITILGKRLVTVDPTTGRINGYADSLAENCYPVDEFLPAAGCVHGDLCWIVISGPAMCLTPMTGAEFQSAAIAAGDILFGLTTSSASTQAGTTHAAGRVAGFSVVAATTTAQFTTLLNQATNWVGHAMSARTSGETNAAILVDVNRRFQM